MCTATTTTCPEDPVVANQEERDAQDANATSSLQEEEKGRPPVVPFPGTIGLAGRITPGLRALITAWILLRQDENRIRVEPQGIDLETLISSLGDSPQLIAHARLLHELELAESELVLINGRNCRGVPVESVQESLIILEGDFSLVFIKPGGDQWLKRLVLLKLPIDSDTGNDEKDSNAASGDGSKNFWVDLNCEMNEVVTEVAPGEDDSASHKVGSTQTIARSNAPEKFSRKELCLGVLPDRPPLWLQTSPVLHGDQILEINGKTFIQELLPDDAQITISMLYQCDPACFSMVVKTPLNRRPVDTPAWRTNLRKTAVAVGGGVMVSAGKYNTQQAVCEYSECGDDISWISYSATFIHRRCIDGDSFASYWACYGNRRSGCARH